MNDLIIPERLAEMERRLTSKTVRDASGCLIWTGYTQPNGYGYINISKSHIPAHRAALLVAGVSIPSGMDVCHRCDIRNCVELAHLYIGTRKQNMADCTARRRHNKPRGESHWCAKLTAKAVSEIKTRRASGETTVAIARFYSINPATVSRISRGIWRTEVSQ